MMMVRNSSLLLFFLVLTLTVTAQTELTTPISDYNNSDDKSRSSENESSYHRFPQLANCDCGIISHTHLVPPEGSPAPSHAWPWVASIVNVSDPSDPVAYCGASLISDRYVLTAAHCIPDMNETGLSNFRVFLGSNFVSEQVAHSEFKILGVKVHPGFNFDTADKDIALLKIDGRIPLHSSSTRWIRPICLLQHNPRQSLTGHEGIILGWGARNLTLPTEEQLQESLVRVVSNEECARNYSKEEIPVTNNMICAELKGGHPCKGDSGGPLVIQDQQIGDELRYTQIGIISHGEGCGIPGYPGIFSRVSSLVGWVRANTRDSVFCRGTFGGD